MMAERKRKYLIQEKPVRIAAEPMPVRRKMPSQANSIGTSTPPAKYRTIR